MMRRAAIGWVDQVVGVGRGLTCLYDVVPLISMCRSITQRYFCLSLYTREQAEEKNNTAN
jgi:hypothetical protein